VIKLKICGLTKEEDLFLAQDLGADFAGFVFYSRSPRFVEPAEAGKMIRKAKARSVRVPVFVGVFVNEDPAKVRRIRSEYGLDIVQLHGDETPEICEQSGRPYWKAVRLKDESSHLELDRFPDTTFLLDTFQEGCYGGSGRPFRPDLVENAGRSGRRIILAGGISIQNLAEVLSLRPIAVDVCSSLEEYPGKKSEEKMRTFFKKWRELETEHD